MTEEYDDFKFHKNLNDCVYAYTVYGKQKVLDDTGTVMSASGYNNNYGYTGRYLDSETGLWYFRARYFDNEMGRFISRDPLGYVDGLLSISTSHFQKKSHSKGIA